MLAMQEGRVAGAALGGLQGARFRLERLVREVSPQEVLVRAVSLEWAFASRSDASRGISAPKWADTNSQGRKTLVVVPTNAKTP
ncbi:hypothetical protein PLANPX_1402 [Lacipirellula parvula]|uniref:Uncharacterized protein n=1 Tax=Lacipirellula parvula TaxID=2650471 RepID=A0A5K7X5I7_9BACT|nr:hypothetical protein PLANPX_1402 [Lacipirellula parvula]